MQDGNAVVDACRALLYYAVQQVREAARVHFLLVLASHAFYAEDAVLHVLEEQMIAGLLLPTQVHDVVKVCHEALKGCIHRNQGIGNVRV